MWFHKRHRLSSTGVLGSMGARRGGANVGDYVDTRRGALVFLINGRCLVCLAGGMGVSSAIMTSEHPMKAASAALKAL